MALSTMLFIWVHINGDYCNQANQQIPKKAILHRNNTVLQFTFEPLLFPTRTLVLILISKLKPSLLPKPHWGLVWFDILELSVFMLPVDSELLSDSIMDERGRKTSWSSPLWRTFWRRELTHFSQHQQLTFSFASIIICGQRWLVETCSAKLLQALNQKIRLASHENKMKMSRYNLSILQQKIWSQVYSSNLMMGLYDISHKRLDLWL